MAQEVSLWPPQVQQLPLPLAGITGAGGIFVEVFWEAEECGLWGKGGMSKSGMT